MPGRIVASCSSTISAPDGADTAELGPTAWIVPSAIRTAAPPRMAGAPVPSSSVSARTRMLVMARTPGPWYHRRHASHWPEDLPVPATRRQDGVFPEDRHRRRHLRLG